jgi:hypothetical protein
VTKPGNSGSEEPTQAEAPEATESETTDQAAETPAGSEEVKATEAVPAKENLADKKAAEAKAAEEAEKKAEPKVRREPAALEKAPPPPNQEALRAQTKRRFEEPPPRTLRFSFYFFIAAGAIWLLSMVASLIDRQDIIDSEVKRNTDPKISPDQIATAVNQILWIVTIAALAFTVFLALFGYKATEGTRRARTLVTIFAVMLVLFHLLLNGTQLGILSAMFALVGLALLWTPSSRKYFPPRQVP